MIIITPKEKSINEHSPKSIFDLFQLIACELSNCRGILFFSAARIERRSAIGAARGGRGDRQDAINNR